MPRKTAVPSAAAEDTTAILPPETQARLRKLIIRNYCCIGDSPVEIDLDQIVVLVGPNNAGKSTILKAYHKITSEPKPTLSIDEFPNREIDESRLPAMELHTAFPAGVPAEHWVDSTTGECIIRERWTWSEPKKPARRQGFDFSKGEWSDAKPWGFDSVANARRPLPHRIGAFDSPEDQAEQVVKLLLSAIRDQAKSSPKTVVDESGTETNTPFGELLGHLAALQKKVVADTRAKIDQAEVTLSGFIEQVFQGYKVCFDAKPEEDLESAFSFFKAGAQLRMGPAAGFQSPIEHQGSGARRTLLWAALRYIAEHGKDVDPSRVNLLLLDEPELCLHPNAVREACRTLYSLADTGKWQVMLTTHSPIFIDLSRDNTTVVRVERSESGDVCGTTVFRPEVVKLDAAEKEEMKLLNLFDPHVAEFFFGGHSILVEGDTEYTAFKYVASLMLDEASLRNLHIIRARGKVTIALLAKILNHFQAKYAVLHDADSPTAMRDGKPIANPAWTNNQKILTQVQQATPPDHVRLCASLPDFEGALFGVSASKEKPYQCLTRLQADEAARATVGHLLRALTSFDEPIPAGWSTWADLAALERALPSSR